MSAKLAIVGITGKMGREILELAPDFGFFVSMGMAATDRTDFHSVPLVTALDKLDPAKVDVVIDFSLPDLTPEVISWCTKHGRPLVSGVTGISDEDKKALAAASNSVPVLWSPNMSLGIAVLSRMLAHLSSVEGFDFQIEELHHNRKKDRPSGTALLLQERLRTAVQTKLPEPVSIRGGGIFGVHKIWAMGEEETITLEHTAMNRRVFARGALKAASWLISQPAGLYGIDDVINSAG